jgi:hypothetical protein
MAYATIASRHIQKKPLETNRMVSSLRWAGFNNRVSIVEPKRKMEKEIMIPARMRGRFDWSGEVGGGEGIVNNG